jgi:hypothetical protein
LAQRPKHLKKSAGFPKLSKKNNDVSSDDDPSYNCIAFAAGFTDRRLWPTGYPDYRWFRDLPTAETMNYRHQAAERL